MAKRLPITLSDKALKHLAKLSTLEKPYILFGVKGGGCNGLKYFIEPIEEPDKMDVLFDINNLSFAVCGKSLLHILGTHVVWKEDVMGSRIEFQNPNASSKCGCGETFST